MNYRDIEIVNSALQNAGQDALRRRQMQQQQDSEMERIALQREMQSEQTRRADAAQKAQETHWENADKAAMAKATQASQPHFKWKSNGVDVTSQNLADLKQYPVDKEESGKHRVTLVKRDDNGNEVTMNWDVDPNIDDAGKQRIGNEMATFAKQFGLGSKTLPNKSNAVEGNLTRAIANVTANPDLTPQQKFSTITALKAQLEPYMHQPDAAQLPTESDVIDNEVGATNPPPAAPQQPKEGSVPTINSQSDYDALPVGSQYRDSNGNLAVKKKR